MKSKAFRNNGSTVMSCDIPKVPQRKRLYTCAKFDAEGGGEGRVGEDIICSLVSETFVYRNLIFMWL